MGCLPSTGFLKHAASVTRCKAESASDFCFSYTDFVAFVEGLSRPHFLPRSLALRLWDMEGDGDTVSEAES